MGNVLDIRGEDVRMINPFVVRTKTLAKMILRWKLDIDVQILATVEVEKSALTSV